MLRGVNALQGITLVTQISSAAELLLRQSQKPGGLVLLPLPTVRKVRLCALEGGWAGCNGLHSSDGQNWSKNWQQQSLSPSLVPGGHLKPHLCVSCSHVSSLWFGWEWSPGPSGKLSKYPSKIQERWGRGEQVKGEAEHSHLHLHRNSSVSIWAAEMTRTPCLLLPKSPPRGELTPTCFFIPEAQIAKSQVGEML